MFAVAGGVLSQGHCLGGLCLYLHHGQCPSPGGPGWAGVAPTRTLGGGCPCLSLRVPALASWKPAGPAGSRDPEGQGSELSGASCATHRGSPRRWTRAAGLLSGDSGGSQLTPFYSPGRRQQTPPPRRCPPPSQGGIRGTLGLFSSFFFTLVSDVICPFLGYIISFGPSGLKTH